MQSGAQPPIESTWCLGSVSEPRPPVGCSPRVRPFPPRPPPEVAFLCSVASSLLRPHPTSHPRTCSAGGFLPSRAGPAQVWARVRPPRCRAKNFSTCTRSPTARGSSHASHYAMGDVAFSFGAAAQHRMGGLQQTPIRGTRGSIALSRPLHPPRRHLQPPPGRARRQQRHLQVEGLRPRWSAAIRVMTLDTHEFIRRFLMHVLPQGFHRIRYYGLLTSPTRAKNIARIRELLAVPLLPIDAIKAANPKASTSAQPEESKAPQHPCPCCGSRMLIIETFLRGQQPNASRSPQHHSTPLPRA